MTRKSSLVLIFIAAVFQFGFVGAYSQPAKSLLNIISPAETPSAASKLPGTAAQIPWVDEQIAGSKALIEKYQTEAFQAQLLAAGLSASTQDDLVDTEHEIVHSYEISRQTLSNVISCENLLSTDVPQTKVLVPQNQNDASELRTRIAKATTDLASVQADQSLLESLSTQAASTVDAAQQEYWRAVEKKQNAGEGAEKSKSVFEFLLSESRLRSANAQLYLYKWRIYLDELTAGGLDAEIAACRDALSASAFDLSLEKTDIPNRITSLKLERESLGPQVKSAIEERTKLGKAFQQALDEQNALPKKPPGASDGYDVQEADLVRQLEIAREASSLGDDLVDGLQVLSSLLGAEIKLWQSVQILQVNHTPEFLKRMNTEAANAVDIYAKAQEVIQTKLQSARTQQERFKEAMGGAGAKETEIKVFCQAGLHVAGERIDNLNRTLEELNNLQDINSKVLSTTTSLLLEESWRERFRNRLQSGKNSLGYLWHYHIATSGDHEITVESVVLALGGLIAAILVAKILSSIVGHTVRTTFHLGVGRAAFVEKWAHYLLSIVLILCVLNWLSIPLTVFAFMGGALAIGVGFGAQNLVNNFISGLILLFEQHIKVGDLVVVDGNQGRVTRLGARFSSIRKFDGVELLVPNSYLLEKTVVNWTLSDPKHRYDFTVGVGYGMDPALVMRILKQALDEQPEVLKDPAPAVYFEEFGSYGLIFRLYYWVLVNDVDTLQVGSDIRLKVDHDCRASGIEIAYPQLDVHMHSGKPFAIRVERSPAV